MRFISHRGNISGKNNELENHPNYILSALNNGFDCEIDIWLNKGEFYLGHDNPQHKIDFRFLIENQDVLWVHCKNIPAVIELNKTSIHHFWHEEDTITLTSKNIIWAFPGNQPILNSVAVMPEIYDEKALSHCSGICSDYILKYKKTYEKI